MPSHHMIGWVEPLLKSFIQMLYVGRLQREHRLNLVMVDQVIDELTRGRRVFANIDALCVTGIGRNSER